jgi:hypothetical protein
MADRTPGQELSDIQRRLRVMQSQNDRVHERLALKYHREEVAREAGPGQRNGELDARYEVGEEPHERPPLL